MAVRITVNQSEDVTVTVKNSSNQLVNPSTFKITTFDENDLPDGGQTFEYGVNNEVTRPGTGTFLFPFRPTTPGVWTLYAVATAPDCSARLRVIVDDRR